MSDRRPNKKKRPPRIIRKEATFNCTYAELEMHLARISRETGIPLTITTTAHGDVEVIINNCK